MIKAQCFYIFHVGKAFWKCHFVLRGPIQHWENCILCRRKDRFLSHWEKKFGNCSSSRNSMSLRLGRIFFQLCHKHAGSSSKIELVMEALCLHWKLRAHLQRFSVVPPWDLSFWAKAIGFHFFKIFKSSCWVPATTKRLLNFTCFFTNYRLCHQRNIKVW